jgi:RsbT co-antagonist protein rsbRD N-terminal domain
MPLTPSPEQRIIGCTLSNFLADRREQIVSQWMESVLADKAIPAADQLTLTQLEDHIPQILEDLTRVLDDALDQDIKARAAWRAGIHGAIRWKENYKIAQLVREISDLRTVLIHHLAEFHDERISTVGGERGVFAMVVLHTFFDRMIQISVERFVSAGKVSEAGA